MHSSLERTGFYRDDDLCSPCRRNLDIELNRLFAQVISSLTAPLLYGVTEFQTNFVLCLRMPLCFAAACRHLSGEGQP